MTVITVKTREHGIEGHLLNSKFRSKLLGFSNNCYSGYIYSKLIVNDRKGSVRRGFGSQFLPR